MSEIEPFEPVAPLDMIASSLRMDGDDLDVLASVLTSKLASILPEGMVSVTRDRSISDRVAKRPGRVTEVSVTTPERTLALSSTGRARVEARVEQKIRGVTISRKSITVAEWTNALATEIAQLAQANAASREALMKLLES